MSLIVIGMIFEVLGSIAIAYTIFRVHEKLLQEKQFDTQVYRAIKIEQTIIAIGIILIVVGFILQIIAHS